MPSSFPRSKPAGRCQCERAASRPFAYAGENTRGASKPTSKRRNGNPVGRALLYVAAQTFLLAGPGISLAAQAPYPLGSYIISPSELPPDPSPPQIFEAPIGFKVTSPAVPEPGYGYLAIARAAPGTQPRGLVMCFTGGEGTAWWAQGATGRAPVLTQELQALGFAVVQLRWTDVWHHSSRNDDCGVARLAFQPATMIKYVYDTYYVPMGISPKIGEAGFCLTGGSGGASQISYALSHYGLDSLVDVLIPTGGPPHATLTKSSLLVSGQEGYWMPDDTRISFDRGFGFYGGGGREGPSYNRDTAFIPRWDEASVAVGGSDYYHPRTRIHFILGVQDRTGVRFTYRDYFERLKSEGSPYVTASQDDLTETGHTIEGTAEGIAALKAAILAPSPAPTGPIIAAGGRIVNLSVRTNAGPGATALIVGFVVGGAGTSGGKPLLVRGIGSTLAQFGVSGALADPQLQLFNGGTSVGANDDWGGTAPLTAAFAQVGAFALPPASKDAALMATFNPTAYSAQISGAAAATGIALAEIYELPGAASVTTPRLVNVSARTRAGTEGDILIAGFVIGGSGPRTVIVRAIGPTLAAFGVAETLVDPQLQLFQGSTLIGANNDWGGSSALSAAFAQVGAFELPAVSKDAALLVTLQPGAYSAQVSGIGNTVGVALVEVYEVP